MDALKRQSRNDIGPGRYDSAKPFGADAKGMKITAPSKEPRLQESPGPGGYNVAEADRATKPKSVSVLITPISHQRTRNVSISDSVDPGAYEPKTKFGDDAKPFRIG